jgi:O-antigen/teichoic acid export membrane protein
MNSKDDSIDSATDASGKSPSAASGGSLKSAAVRGSTITLIGHGLSVFIRVFGNLVITRLLVPEYFGVIALVNVLMVGLYLFSDIGVGPNIIQSARGNDPLFLNTAWTVQVTRGFILWAVACALAWPMAVFYQKPELVYLVPVVGLNAVSGGFASTKLFTLNRNFSFIRLNVLELTCQLVGVLAMIAAGWVWRSIWALVISGLVTSALRTLLSHAFLPGQSNRLAWDPSSQKELLDFGRWIFISSAVTFLANQNDRLVLGKLVSSYELGLYSIAANLAVMPSQALSQVANKVFYPVIAAAMRKPDHDPSSIRVVRNKLLWVLTPAFALAISMAPSVVSILYDPRYHRVGRMASYLLIGTWLSTIATSYIIVLLANAQPKFFSFGQAAKTIISFVLIWLIAPRFGIEAVALVVGISELGLIAFVAYGCKSLHVVTLGAELGFTAIGAVLTGGFLGIHWLLMKATGNHIVALVAVTAVGLGMTGYLFRRVRLI